VFLLRLLLAALPLLLEELVEVAREEQSALGSAWSAQLREGLVPQEAELFPQSELPAWSALPEAEFPLVAAIDLVGPINSPPFSINPHMLLFLQILFDVQLLFLL
jgi:hypothetical protein